MKAIKDVLRDLPKGWDGANEVLVHGSSVSTSGSMTDEERRVQGDVFAVKVALDG